MEPWSGPVMNYFAALAMAPQTRRLKTDWHFPALVKRRVRTGAIEIGLMDLI